jgi:hypothetical protein
MSVLTVVALALAVVIVVAAIRAVARRRQEPQLASHAIEVSRGAVDAERAQPEPASEPAQPGEPAPVESRRSVVPPAVTEALASEPEVAAEPVREEEREEEAAAAGDPVPADEAATVPPPAPEAAVTPVAPVVAAADRASIEAEDPERKKARKLARLFVSEIKLYNEKLVVEGRAAGDLYARLKDSIDQSLVAFERRIPEAVRAEFDYLHDELVRQLAEGDATKLGTHYRRQPRSS